MEQEILEIFFGELGTWLAEARTLRASLNSGEPSSARDLARLFHKVAGAAASVELPMLASVADLCERASRRSEEGALTAPQLVPFVDEAIAVFDRVVTQKGEGAEATETKPMLVRADSSSGRKLVLPTAESADAPLVLIIDDDMFSAQRIEESLLGAGYRTRVSLVPQEALTIAAAEPPDIIILDVEMPQMDGFELCRQLRALVTAQFTPILFVTRRGDLEQRLRGLEAGGNDYLTKPVAPAELIARVRSQLSRLAELRDLAIRDGLTRCYNHRYFKVRLSQEVNRAFSLTSELTLLLVDVDHFKRVNDGFGHPAGDVLLSHLASLLTASLRDRDVVARYGGEEFGILLMEAGQAEAMIVAQRMCERVRRHVFQVPRETGSLDLRVTVSVGLASLVRTDGPESLLARADAALYTAKLSGRDQVRIADPSAPAAAV